MALPIMNSIGSVCIIDEFLQLAWTCSNWFWTSSLANSASVNSCSSSAICDSNSASLVVITSSSKLSVTEKEVLISLCSNAPQITYIETS